MTFEGDQMALALPGYEVGGTIGRGAWGQVLSGRHRALGRDVAIKQLPRAFAADPAVRARFTTEGRLLASLDHPHIVPVFDFVEQDSLCLLVMELLPGGTVWSRFTSEGFTPPAACATVLAAAAGLHAAHLKNVLHRDVKPENLMFSADGVVKVTDFGIAKVVGGDATLATRAGEVVGTPAYIAPEQARGAALSPATDVYALATVLYELLSGQLPFSEEGDAMALLFRHSYEEPAPLDQKAPTVPAQIVPVVMRALATAPEERYASAESFAVALAEVCTAAWGPGWLTAEGVPVMGAAPVVAATERLSLDFTPAAAPFQQLGTPTPTVGTASAPAPTVVRPPTPPELQRARSTIVRPVPSERAEGVAIADLQGAAVADLVPLQQVVKGPPRATKHLAVSLVAFALVVIVALVGLGKPAALGGDVRAGTLQVQGVTLSGTTVSVNFSRPVLVRALPGAPAADRARLSLLLLGHAVIQASAPLKAQADGTRTATIDLSAAHYLMGGHVTAEVDLLGAGGTTVGHARFAARAAQQAWTTVAGAVVAALALFSLAYIEQFARARWRGRRRASATAGLGLSVAILAIAVVGAAWLAEGRQPTLPGLVACTALGLVSGLAGAPAAYRAGRRRRLRRRAARAAATGPSAALKRAA
jgi:serine/threonine-protein kinase